MPRAPPVKWKNIQSLVIECKNILAVAEIVFRNYEAGGYPSNDTCVLTPYKAQKTKIHQVLFHLSNLGLLPKEHHHLVATIGASQGSEYDCVITDFVVTDSRDLGFTKDENRCNVAFMRAKSAIIALLPCQLATVHDGDHQSRREPHLVAYTRKLIGDDHLFFMLPRVFSGFVQQAMQSVSSTSQEASQAPAGWGAEPNVDMNQASTPEWSTAPDFNMNQALTAG